MKPRLEGFVDCLRKAVERVDITTRERNFRARIRRAGLDIRLQHELYAISCRRTPTTPSVEWTQLSNVVMRLDEDNLPTVVACGPPEIVPMSSEEFPDILTGIADGMYRVEQMLYGRVCWLYYHNKWTLGTRRSADARNIVLRIDGPTMWEGFMETLKGSISTPISEFLESLDTELCYGFVFHHRDIHIYTDDNPSNSIWHVSTMDKSGNSSMSKLGLSRPPLILRRSGSSEIEIKGKIAHLCNRSSEALINAGKGKDRFLGFILRPTTVGCKHLGVVVKSPLYAYIESLIGEIIPLRKVLIKVYLNGEVTLFLSVFPYLSEDIAEVGSAFEELLTILMTCHDQLVHHKFVTMPDNILELYEMLRALGGRFEKGNIRAAILSASPQIFSAVAAILFALVPAELDSRRGYMAAGSRKGSHRENVASAVSATRCGRSARIARGARIARSNGLMRVKRISPTE